MSEPLDNVDEFRVSPVDSVAGLVPDQDAADRIVGELRGSGADVSDVGVLHGSEGADILDAQGRQHGTRARVVRWLQGMGYSSEIMTLYVDGLRAGRTLVVVPCSPADRDPLHRLFATHGGQDIYYFGSGSAESLR